MHLLEWLILFLNDNTKWWRDYEATRILIHSLYTKCRRVQKHFRKYTYHITQKPAHKCLSVFYSWSPKSYRNIQNVLQLLNIHTVEYYTTIKRNKLLMHATTWMDHKGIMLSEISQSPKATDFMIPFIRPSGKGKIGGMENRSGVARSSCRETAWLKGKAWGNLGGTGNALSPDCGAGYTTLCVCQKPQNCLPQRVAFTVCKSKNNCF